MHDASYRLILPPIWSFSPVGNFFLLIQPLCAVDSYHSRPWPIEEKKIDKHKQLELTYAFAMNELIRDLKPTFLATLFHCWKSLALTAFLFRFLRNETVLFSVYGWTIYIVVVISNQSKVRVNTAAKSPPKFGRHRNKMRHLQHFSCCLLRKWGITIETLVSCYQIKQENYEMESDSEKEIYSCYHIFLLSYNTRKLRNGEW